MDKREKLATLKCLIDEVFEETEGGLKPLTPIIYSKKGKLLLGPSGLWSLQKKPTFKKKEER